MTVILLELNEINIGAIEEYTRRGDLPNFSTLIKAHGVSETSSEVDYENIEPWVQWVTAHTGLDYADHGVFRLGDIRGRNIEQIWENLERQGISVGAISPMNAENRCENPAFFVPDPWTQGRLSGPWVLRQLYGAVVQAVNDNAQSKIASGSVLKLIMGLVKFGRLGSTGRYQSLIMAALRKQSWAKALVLDRLLADVFLNQVTRTKPGFASLFLNAGAHIQHHYMFSSSVYDGPLRNPIWYVAPNQDPVLDAYRLYDEVIGDIRAAMPDARLIIATGLHQVPHGELTFYWRLKDYEAFLTKLGVAFTRVEPRMSRDFLLTCSDTLAALDAERRIAAVTALDGTSLFSIDNRGTDLFVTLTWPHDIEEDFVYRFGNEQHSGLRGQVAFVAIKNGEHDGTGYVIDTGAVAREERFPLREMPMRIAKACGVEFAV